jgi:hypothetical protein
MLERIYTIPINEAFDACAADNTCGCPFCRLETMLESNELDIILGGAMMEPDIRIKTNAQGFCRRHYDALFAKNNRLGLGLVLESHLDELRSQLEPGGIAVFAKGGPAPVAVERLQRLDKSCYICGRVGFSLGRMLANAAALWDTEKEFRDKTAAQPYFCLKHFPMWCEEAKPLMNKKRFAEFYEEVSKVVLAYFDTLRADVSWFCKKFDYRYENEPWGNSKDAVERAIRFLRGV